MRRFFRCSTAYGRENQRIQTPPATFSTAVTKNCPDVQAICSSSLGKTCHILFLLCCRHKRYILGYKIACKCPLPYYRVPTQWHARPQASERSCPRGTDRSHRRQYGVEGLWSRGVAPPETRREKVPALEETPYWGGRPGANYRIELNRKS
jgi:hypothetical protein